MTPERIAWSHVALSAALTLASALAVLLSAASMVQLVLWVTSACGFTLLLLRESPVPPRAERLLLGAALTAGALLLAGPLQWSDDAHRYLFDGHATLAGVHPLAYAPQSPKVADWIAATGPINHAHLPSIYPPFAQYLFALGASVGLGLVGWKLVNALALPLAYAISQRTKRCCGSLSLGTAIVAHPLVLQTVCADAHVDAWALPVMLAFLLLAQRSAAGAGAALGFGAGLKLFPLALPVVLLGRQGPRQTIVAGAAAAAVFALLAVPFATLGAKSFGSLGVYGATWTFNPTGWAAIRWAVHGLLAASGVPESLEWPAAAHLLSAGVAGSDWISRDQLVDAVAKLLSVGLMGGVVLWAWARKWRIERAAVWVIGALWLLSPVVHPWYLLWLLPVACWSRSAAAMIWCATILLAYVANVSVALGYGWGVPLWATFLQLVPCIFGHVLTEQKARP